MTSRRLTLTVLLVALNSTAVANNKTVETDFNNDLRVFEINHDRSAFQSACEAALNENSRFDLGLFFLGVLNGADEHWAAAKIDFEQFLDSGSPNDGLNAKAAAEIKKLPILIAEDSTATGKTNRQYREHLALAKYLDAQGFAKEAFLEAGTAAKLAPDQWQAYAMASVILLRQDRQADALHFQRRCLERHVNTFAKNLRVTDPRGIDAP